MYFEEKVLEIVGKYYAEYLGTTIMLNAKIDATKVTKHPVIGIIEFLNFEHHYSFRENKHINIKELFQHG